MISPVSLLIAVSFLYLVKEFLESLDRSLLTSDLSSSGLGLCDVPLYKSLTSTGIFGVFSFWASFNMNFVLRVALSTDEKAYTLVLSKSILDFGFISFPSASFLSFLSKLSRRMSASSWDFTSKILPLPSSSFSISELMKLSLSSKLPSSAISKSFTPSSIFFSIAVFSKSRVYVPTNSNLTSSTNFGITIE